MMAVVAVVLRSGLSAGGRDGSAVLPMDESKMVLSHTLFPFSLCSQLGPVRRAAVKFLKARRSIEPVSTLCCVCALQSRLQRFILIDRLPVTLVILFFFFRFFPFGRVIFCCACSVYACVCYSCK